MYMFKMKNVCKPKLLRSSDMRNEIQKFADFIAVVYHHHHHDNYCRYHFSHEIAPVYTFQAQQYWCRGYIICHNV